MSNVTLIESSTATFTNITKAVEYLDNKYGRINWTNSLQHLERIRISGIDVYVNNGFRCDPDDSQWPKVSKWIAKYPEYSTRLS
jgi:hypothetical protein